MLKINDWIAPAPSALAVELFHAGQDVNRSASGMAVMDRCIIKRRLEIAWAYMPAAQLAHLMESTGGFFEVLYPDPQTGVQRSMPCYCSGRSAAVLRMQDGQPVWNDVKMTLTER